MSKLAKNVDILIVGNEGPLVDRAVDLANTFDYSFHEFSSIDNFLDNADKITGKFVVNLSNHANGKDVGKQVELLKQYCEGAYIIAVVGKKMSLEDTVFAKQAGANYVILENEFLTTSKPEFIANQAVRASYVPVKESELKVGTIIPFDLFHIMPLNRKYLPISKAGSELSDEKKQKYKNILELYCRREDAGLFAKYVRENSEPSPQGLAARCRAEFLAMSSGFADLVLLITDQSEVSSFDAGKKLYEVCRSSSSSLLSSLGKVGSATEVITNSAVDDFGTIERSPAVAAIAGLLSLVCEIGDPEEVVLSAMLCDIGMVELSPSIPRKLKKGEEFNGEERERFNLQSLISLNLCLARRIPIEDSMRNIINAVNERADGKGPQNFPPEHVPMEAQLIQLCRLIDNASSLKWSRERRKPSEVRDEILEQEKLGGRFSSELIEKIQSKLSVIPNL